MSNSSQINAKQKIVFPVKHRPILKNNFQEILQQLKKDP
jgi:hypothetical protein